MVKYGAHNIFTCVRFSPSKMVKIVQLVKTFACDAKIIGSSPFFFHFFIIVYETFGRITQWQSVILIK